MKKISGKDLELQWLIVAAFRYALTRHSTQFILNIEDVIFNNIKLLQDCSIKSFIQDIYYEQFKTSINEWDVGTLQNPDTSYLNNILERLQQEYISRGYQRIER